MACVLTPENRRYHEFLNACQNGTYISDGVGLTEDGQKVYRWECQECGRVEYIQAQAVGKKKRCISCYHEHNKQLCKINERKKRERKSYK